MSFKNIRIFQFIVLTAFFAGCSTSSNSVKTSLFNINLDTVKAQRFDTGKMWTFEYAPLDYFQNTYNFRPSDEWLGKVRKSALRFATYCSASFVSEDGLVMTNDHCGRSSITVVSREGEDLHKDGFFAERLEDERKVNGLFVDQLVLIKDVTKEIHDAINSVVKDDEKLMQKEIKINELVSKYKKETGLEINITSLYYGGKYSLYGYKRYNDVRLVFAPETQLGFFGGDYDNFTYPRYNMDVTFFRVYDDSSKPLKTENYFKWSNAGAYEGEPVFVVGNPGRTNRLNTISQLEYLRDIKYPSTLFELNGIIDVYEKIIKSSPEKKNKMMDKLYGYTNSKKVYEGMIKGLNDPVLMARKQDFEIKFRSAVKANSRLSEYKNVWDNIEDIREDLRKYAHESDAYSLPRFLTSEYFNIAKEVITIANELQLPEEQRLPEYQSSSLDSLKNNIFPEDFDKAYNDLILEKHLEYIIYHLGKEDKLVKSLVGDKSGKEAVQYLLQKSKIISNEKIAELLNNSPMEILNSDDPFIYFLLNTKEKLNDIRSKMKALLTKEEVLNQKLGRALFEVYGTSIPPDATFTLRISDGIVKGYDYNGTKAPSKVSFYGLYDRYYSFSKEYPWSLPERWQNPPAEFDLETPFNFISTNDIIGGNSGSPVINKNAEIVGIAFDGNIESLPGNFIFTTEANRCVSVASEGMAEAIQDLYKAERLNLELKSGKIPLQYMITSENADKKGN